MIKKIIGYTLLSPLIIIASIPILFLQLIVCIGCLIGLVCDYFIKDLTFKQAIENYKENICDW